jgi:hypothetical protein
MNLQLVQRAVAQGKVVLGARRRYSTSSAAVLQPRASRWDAPRRQDSVSRLLNAVCPHPVFAIQRIGPGPASTASKAQTAACVWSTCQDFPTLKAFHTSRNNRASERSSSLTPRGDSLQLS